MADALAASLDIDTEFASCSVKRFEPRPSATADRFRLKAGQLMSCIVSFSPMDPAGSEKYGMLEKQNIRNGSKEYSQ
jgi:hypothetical protein